MSLNDCELITQLSDTNIHIYTQMYTCAHVNLASDPAVIVLSGVSQYARLELRKPRIFGNDIVHD